MSRSRLFVSVVVFAVTVATGVGGASANPGEGTHVDGIAAVLHSGGVEISGQATFVDVPVVVAEDGTDDASRAPIGDDLTTLLISRPDPFDPTVTFTLGVANEPPVGLPEALVYSWTFRVRTAGGPSTTYELSAKRAVQVDGPRIGPVFKLHACDAQWPCPVIDILTGTMANGVVEWDVPLTAIGAQVGSVINGSQAKVIFVSEYRTPVRSGRVLFDQTPASEVGYTVPGPSVRVGIAPAGTAPENVALTVDGSLDNDGTFTGQLAAPSVPGDYVVAAKACHPADSCGLATTTVTYSQ